MTSMNTQRKNAQRKQPTTGPASASSSASDRPAPTRPWGRYFCALLVAVFVAALLFELTMVYTLGVGVYIVAAGEMFGLWLVAGGYVLGCIPALVGLLISTGRPLRSLLHALWVGLLYSLAGYLLLDQALQVL